MSLFRKVTSTLDGDQLDAFSNQRIAEPSYVFDAQLTYDLQPLVFEQVTSGTGSVTHDATNRLALIEADAASDSAYMQSYEHFRYQSGRAQEISITFNFNDNTGLASVTQMAGYSDGTDGIEFQLSGTTKQFLLRSSTTAGNQTATQANWNEDTLDGNGDSGLTLDTSKTNILLIDLQALYAGKVRLGFSIDGVIIWAHKFSNANSLAYPYIATANLPVRVGISNGTGGAITKDCHFICCSVASRGGQAEQGGYDFSYNSTATAASGARTHALSIQPKATFNSIVNRSKIVPLYANITNTGASPVYWELCLGDVITGTTTFNDVNATYSGVQYNTAGTTSGSPAIVIASGYVPATAQVKDGTFQNVTSRYPLTLDSQGAVRTNKLGTLTLLLTGDGGASACRSTIGWREIR